MSELRDLLKRTEIVDDMESNNIKSSELTFSDTKTVNPDELIGKLYSSSRIVNDNVSIINSSIDDILSFLSNYSSYSLRKDVLEAYMKDSLNCSGLINRCEIAINELNSIVKILKESSK